MRLRTVFGDGGRCSGLKTASMAGDPDTVMKDLHRGCRGTDLYAVAGQVTWRAIIMTVQLNVMVITYTAPLPLSESEGFDGQGFKRRALELFEHRAAAAVGQLAERPLVELFT